MNHGVVEMINPDKIADKISGLIALIPLARSLNPSGVPPLDLLEKPKFADPLKTLDPLTSSLPATLDEFCAKPPPFLVRDDKYFQGGCITSGLRFWRDTLLPAAALPDSKTSRILSWLQYGVHLPDFFKYFRGRFAGLHFDSASPPRFSAPNRPMPDPTHRDFVTAEITRLLQIQAIQISETIPHVVCPLGVVDNRSKLRLILDARFTNLWSPSPPMSYESLRQFQHGLDIDDLLFSLDHKAGYHHVPLTPDSYKYVGFKWQTHYYVFKVLPFGWAPACYVYQTLSSVVAAYLRRLAIHTIVYLDDFGCALKSYLDRSRQYLYVWATLAVMYLANYFVAIPKSNLLPATTLRLLGFGIDTHRQRFFVPKDKMESILAALRSAQSAPSLPLEALQSLTGKLQALSLAVPPISIFLRSLHAAIAAAERTRDYNIRLSDDARTDLRDLEQLRSWERLSRWPREQHAAIRLDTDASSNAWGAVIFLGSRTLTAGSSFTRPDRDLAIHVKEMLAIRYALSYFRTEIHDCFLDIHVDNTVVEAAALTGKSINAELRQFARFLLQFQLDSNAIVRIHRVTTADNVVADSISRGRPLHTIGAIDRSDHHLNPTLFQLVESHYGCTFSIDACANLSNRQTRRFIARVNTGHPDQVATNVFMWSFPNIDGLREIIYCNPPWQLISPLWRHFRLCRTRGVIIVPDMPDKPWFGMLMATDPAPFCIARKGSRDVFFQPSLNYSASVGPVPWNVLTFRFDFSGNTSSISN
jgi:hypothetical protein